MPEKYAIKTLYSILVSGGSVLVVGAASFILNSIVKTTDQNKIEAEKDLSELKGQTKEQIQELKKDLGEAFGRIRDLETIQNIIKTECDMNHGRGRKNGK